MNQAVDVYEREAIPESAEREILSMLASGDLFRYTSGEDSPVAKLEREFAEFTGKRFALAVNSCSSALFLSLQALGLEPGSRVIIPAFTFSAVPSSIVHANCQPVLVNVGSNYRIDLDDFYRKLDDDIGAVMISHMRGHTSDMTAILDACKTRSIPVIEDAAHSLGTTWDGRLIGTLGKVGCYSFQSYKLVNSGEGGMLITDDPDLFARATIMSGAYEHNWKKHPVVSDRFTFWQNRLPLYNLRMNNLSAAVVRSQISEIPRRSRKGLENYNYVASILNQSPWLEVPDPLPQEVRSPDSIQFNLVGIEDDETAYEFEAEAERRGVSVKTIGLAQDNARAFWNWEYLGPQEDLSPTRRVLMRACDVRLPVHLDHRSLEQIARAIVESVEMVKTAPATLN